MTAEREQNQNESFNYGKRQRTTDNGGVSAESAGYAGGAEGRHDDDEAGRLADDEAGGDCHEHPEPGDEGRREGCPVHPEHSDEGEDHEEKINPNNMMDLSVPDKREAA